MPVSLVCLSLIFKLFTFSFDLMSPCTVPSGLATYSLLSVVQSRHISRKKEKSTRIIYTKKVNFGIFDHDAYYSSQETG